MATPGFGLCLFALLSSEHWVNDAYCGTTCAVPIEIMKIMDLGPRVVVEFVGTALLVAVVVGSGIMAQSLTSDGGVALLLNQLSTVFGLGVLILVTLPLSGAHLNPAVTLAFVLRRGVPLGEALAYGASQLIGGLAGVLLAQIMFDRPLLEVATQERLSVGTFVSEIVATTGLIVLILLLVDRGQASLIPVAVPVWIGAGYVFTSSTAFANPAVTLGRMFSDSFAGIAPLSGGGFMGAQVVGVALALVIVVPLMVHKKEAVDV